MAIQEVKAEKTIKELFNVSTRGESLTLDSEHLRFDLAIQRNTVWDEERKSLFIHSLLYGYPFPPVYAVDNMDDQLWFLDGKQRLTTVEEFLQDGFVLEADTEDVDGEEIAGQAFSELSEKLQDRLLGKFFVIYQFRNMDDDEIDEMFRRLNNGMALNKMELNRVLAGTTVMNFVHELLETEFFNKKVQMSDKQRTRFHDEELLVQIAMLIDNKLQPMGLGSDEIKDFAIKTKEKGLTDEIKDVMKNTTEYLNTAFPQPEKFLRKNHTGALFVMAIKAQNKNIDPVQFAGWAVDFFENRTKNTVYSKASGSGSAKKENVRKRLEEIEKDFAYYIDKSPEFKLPEIREAEKKAKKEAEKKAKALAGRNTAKKGAKKDAEPAKKDPEVKEPEVKKDEEEGKEGAGNPLGELPVGVDL